MYASETRASNHRPHRAKISTNGLQNKQLTKRKRGTEGERERENSNRNGGTAVAGGVVCGQNVAYYLPVVSGWGESIGVQSWKRLESIFIATVQHVRPAGKLRESASFPYLSLHSQNASNA